MKKFSVLLVAVSMVFVSGAFGQSLINDPDADVSVYLEAELGFVGILSHTLQIGDTGTNFDYVTQGGQEILFPIDRYVAGIDIVDRHRVQFLYQPLLVATDVVFREDVTIDGVVFAQDTPMNLSYGFPFYRLSYWFDFVEGDVLDLAAGLSLQLRNASIRFAAANGEALTVSQNLGPVPAINLYGRYTDPSGLRLTLDAVGFYASSAFFNGADFDFEGSILDASLRVGYLLPRNVELFANLRFLGGSAKGTSEYEDRFWSESVAAYTDNQLATFILSLGARIE